MRAILTVVLSGWRDGRVRSLGVRHVQRHLRVQRQPRVVSAWPWCSSWTTAWPRPRTISQRLTGTVSTKAIASDDGQAPPEQAGRADRPPSRRGRRSDEQVVDDLHRSGSRRCRRRARAGRLAGARRRGGVRRRRSAGSRRRRPAPPRARCSAASPQPHQVASTMPSTSPIAQPVRQCSVALTAVRPGVVVVFMAMRTIYPLGVSGK